MNLRVNKKKYRVGTHQFLECGGARQRVEESEGLVGDATQLRAVRREARYVRQSLLQREEAEKFT